MDLSINRLASGTISLFSSPTSEPTKFVAVALAALALLGASFYLLWQSCWKSKINEIDAQDTTHELGEEVIDLDGNSFVIGEEASDSLPSTPTTGSTGEDQIQSLLTSVKKKGNINPTSLDTGVDAEGKPFVRLHFATPIARNRALAELRGKEIVDKDSDISTPTKSTTLMLTPYPYKGAQRTGYVDGRKVQKKLDLE